MKENEQIVLLNEQGEPIGTAPKLESHHGNTPLHLAFSCYVFNGKNELLVTRRALSKKVWPGVWTNSVCGHPRPMRRTSLPPGTAGRAASALGSKSDFSLRSSAHRITRTARSDAQEEIKFVAQANGSWEVEPTVDAIKRRLKDELGMSAKNFKVVLPNYRYKTPPFNGIIENEICPVYIALATSDPIPNPDEVEEFKWMNWQNFIKETKADKNDKYSFWCKDQIKQLKLLINCPNF